jgi:hypothetical protein
LVEKFGFEIIRQRGSHVVLMNLKMTKDSHYSTNAQRSKNWYTIGNFKTCRNIQGRIHEKLKVTH